MRSFSVNRARTPTPSVHRRVRSTAWRSRSRFAPHASSNAPRASATSIAGMRIPPSRRDRRRLSRTR
ncbi:hypothetical protein AI46_24450 [Burkholderia multivorans R-20526]|nr:hypothetical protein AI46_24450 [Burkholderia multivorans R-20526]